MSQDTHNPSPRTTAPVLANRADGLNDDDRAKVNDIFANGPDALRTNWRMSLSEIRAFINRPDVRAEVDALTHELGDVVAIDRRRKFMGYRTLGYLAPKALGVLDKALDGPRYMRGSDGRIMRDAFSNNVIVDDEPTPGQLRAAMDVLDRLGINKTDPTKIALAGINIKLSYGQIEEDVPIVYDDDVHRPIEQAQSRDRRRKVMEALAEFIPELSQVVNTKAKAVHSKIVEDKKRYRRKSK